MSKTSKSHGKGGRGWRLLALATVLFFIAAGIYFVIVPVQESKRHEQTLIEQFGWADKYTPSIDGSIPPQRVEAFIRVREAVQTNCADYQGILDDLLNSQPVLWVHPRDQTIQARGQLSRSYTQYAIHLIRPQDLA